MATKFIRVYKKLDANAIKPHLLIYGDLTGSCANCNKIDLKLEMNLCPECNTEFKYVAFRSVKSHIPKLFKLNEQRPSLTIIDYDDYVKATGKSKAEDFFG